MMISQAQAKKSGLFYEPCSSPVVSRDLNEEDGHVFLTLKQEEFVHVVEKHL